MRLLNALPGAGIAVLGCVLMGFGVKGEIAQANHGSLCRILLGILILTFGGFLGTVTYLAPKYGTKVGRKYYFDNNSPMALVIPLGVVLICLEGGLVYWVARHG